MILAAGLVFSWITSVAQPLEHAEWTRNATLYEVNTRQATPEGTFNAFQSHLPRLKEMGVDILWFMPIQPIGVLHRKGILGSYYSISDYTAINPEFGSEYDFEMLVMAAHALEMKVIIDWVPNHTAWDHHWMTEHPEYFWRDAQGIISNGRNDHDQPTDWTDVAELDYSNDGLQQAMREEMAWWVHRFQLDGFRCDMAGGVPFDFWAETNRQLRDLKPDLFLLAESNFPGMHRSGFDMTYGWEFHHVLNKVAGKGESVAALDSYLAKQRKEFPEDAYLMMFIDNHDENSWNGTVQKRLGANAQAAFALCVAWEKSMPLIYNGQEVSLNKSLRFFERDTIDWNGSPQTDFYSRMMDLKHKQPALANGQYGGEQIPITTQNDRVYAFSRSKGDNTVVFMANFDGEEQKIHYSGAPAGTYTNAITGKKIRWSAKGKKVLPANSFYFLTR